jgi:hypothetical protein
MAARSPLSDIESRAGSRPAPERTHRFVQPCTAQMDFRCRHVRAPVARCTIRRRRKSRAMEKGHILRGPIAKNHKDPE